MTTSRRLKRWHRDAMLALGGLRIVEQYDKNGDLISRDVLRTDAYRPLKPFARTAEEGREWLARKKAA